MSKSNLKVVAPSAHLSGAQLERIAAGIALTLGDNDIDRDGLFLLMQEIGRNCHDWTYIENIANTISRHLLIFTQEFDEAELKMYERLRAEVKR